MPRKLVTGERATLAVLDVNGKLTPDVHIEFSNGDKLATDATGRAAFVAPLAPGPIYGSIAGRMGRVASVVLTPADVPSTTLQVDNVPRVASLMDRFETLSHGRRVAGVVVGTRDVNLRCQLVREQVRTGGSVGREMAAVEAGNGGKTLGVRCC